MTHREDKKEAKQGSKKNKNSDVTHVDEIKKSSTKGVIKGTE